MASVHDVADYIRAKRGSDLDPWSLQKLAYYCKAWSLAWGRGPLFPETFEAWRDGPVCPPLRLQTASNKDGIVDADRQTIDAVLDCYGGFTKPELIELTHREQPWRRARQGLAPEIKSSNPIPDAHMASFYRSTGIVPGTFPDAFKRGIRLMLDLDEDPQLDETDLVEVETDPQFQAWLDGVPGAVWPTSHV